MPNVAGNRDDYASGHIARVWINGTTNYAKFRIKNCEKIANIDDQ